jgi:PAS domain S-box-containing protein
VPQVDGEDGALERGCLWASAPRSIEFLAEIVDHVGAPIFVKDRQFRWVVLNLAFCHLVGHSRQELLGKTDYDFFPRPEADFFRQKDVELFATESSVVIDEEPITDAQGQRHVLATQKVPMRNADGEVTHLVGIIHDITHITGTLTDLRTRSEVLEDQVRERTALLSEAQAALVRKERLAVLGQLAGGLAHQIRNPLGSIMNAAYLLQRALAGHPDPDVGRAIAIVHEEAWQANRIITDLIDYARVRPALKRVVDLRDVVEQALAAQSIGPGVEIKRQLDELPMVAIDSDQVRDALENLLRNAIEAMPEGGKLSIRLQQDPGGILLEICDNGPGIAEDVQGRLFEPLVTTKPLGLGLGLTTTRALIENQEGTVQCRSRPGRTCFEVRLPLPSASDLEGLRDDR